MTKPLNCCHSAHSAQGADIKFVLRFSFCRYALELRRHEAESLHMCVGRGREGGRRGAVSGNFEFINREAMK